jgi:hypothetical protein
MTALQEARERFIKQGCRPSEALQKMARKFDLDVDTIKRSLFRADGEDRKAAERKAARQAA